MLHTICELKMNRYTFMGSNYMYSIFYCESLVYGGQLLEKEFGQQILPYKRWMDDL